MFEIEVVFGPKREVTARLILAPVPKQVAAQRRRKMREKARTNGRQPTQKTLLRCDWTLLLTNTSAEQLPTTTVLEIYRVRWQVETLFAALKTRGFCLEQTHLTDPIPLERLLALLALTFCLCHKLGEWVQTEKALKLKKHGNKPKSIFRLGFDKLRNAIANFTHFDLKTWQKLLQILSCT